MALYSECCFPIGKIMANKVTFVGFRGGNRPRLDLFLRPRFCLVRNRKLIFDQRCNANQQLQKELSEISNCFRMLMVSTEEWCELVQSKIFTGNYIFRQMFENFLCKDEVTALLKSI